ncbi:DUF2195 family protein [Pseudomonas aeruginosa]|uniref:DUF2195 family protein n=1 Tax=Pseudomonas aeruginosa TaxID=287 RepID=UPI0003C3A2EC|nr:DUF2195 family protein [Pseudomonas aeruginosa]ESR72813.1 hypothetical protein T266_01680 [Pseudomonas aeruginosa VRFPA05]EJV1369665.1 DUF2195 family protein [Pseudomonas aeruginosa]EJV1386325.1 DUF2195 family protein [Pseudomonas aeruginosa]EJV1609641.1 DUF2195 family protein [Pseudomonas aeruginosa]EKD1561210.1 DUF2195 family protein [Pseudomonas aeruginosa]
MDAKALLLGSLCLAAPFAGAATLDNALSACLAARLGAPHTAEGQLHLPLILEARRSTGECGCTSALVRYRLLAMHANAKAQVLQEGLLDGRYEGTRTLTLAADAQLAADSTLVVRLGCAVAE